MTMRRAALVAFMAPILVSAQVLGTKPEPIGRVAASSGTSAAPMIQMVLALLIVGALLKWAMPWFLKKGWAIKSAGQRAGDLQVGGGTTMGTGTLHLVQAKGRTLLLASGPTGISMIADLTDVNAPEPPLFAEIVHKELERPNVAPLILANDEDPDSERARAALDRLERLIG